MYTILKNLKKVLVVTVFSLTSIISVTSYSERKAEFFLKDLTVNGVGLSPSGKYIAYFTRVEAGVESAGKVEILDTETGERATVLGSGNNELRVGSVIWLSDDVLWIRVRKTKFMSEYHPVIYYVKSKKITTIWEAELLHSYFRFAKLLTILPDDPAHVIFQRDNRFYKVNIYTFEHEETGRVKRWLSRGDIVLDQNYEPRIAIHQKKFGTKIYVNDIGTSKISKYWDFDNRTMDVVEPLGFSKHGELYAALYDEGMPVVNKFKLDIDDKKGVLASNEVIKNIHGQKIYDKSGVLIGLSDAVEGGDLYFDKELASLQSKLNEQFSTHKVEILDLSSDYNSYVVLVSNRNDPGTLYFGTVSSRRITPFANMMEGYDNEDAPHTKHYSLQDSNLEFDLTLPTSSESSAPLLVLFETLLFLEEPEYSALAKYYASNGYAVLRVQSTINYGEDRRIYWPIPSDFESIYLESLQKAYQYIKSMDEIDSSQVCALGMYRQAYFALRAVAEKTVEFDCAIFVEPLVDPENYIKRTGYGLAAKQLFDVQEISLDRRSPIENIDKYDIPLLLIREVKEGYKWRDNTNRFYKKLSKLNKSVVLKDIELDYEKTFNDGNRQKIHSEVVEYLNSRLKN